MTLCAKKVRKVLSSTDKTTRLTGKKKQVNSTGRIKSLTGRTTISKNSFKRQRKLIRTPFCLMSMIIHYKCLSNLFRSNLSDQPSKKLEFEAWIGKRSPSVQRGCFFVGTAFLQWKFSEHFILDQNVDQTIYKPIQLKNEPN